MNVRDIIQKMDMVMEENFDLSSILKINENDKRIEEI